MTSVRKAVKKAKNRANKNTAPTTLTRLGFLTMAQLFCGEYPKSISELDAVLIRRLARLKQLNTRLERKKRKQGKWQEWLEFKAYAKRQRLQMKPFHDALAEVEKASINRTRIIMGYFKNRPAKEKLMMDELHPVPFDTLIGDLDKIPETHHQAMQALDAQFRLARFPKLTIKEDE